MVNMNACVCLAGWYFQQELLDALCSATGIQLYIISHQPPQAVQKGIFQTLPENHLFFERNIGYDWGAYQQFTAKDIWKNFETVFFMHDDLTLLDTAIFSICHDTIHTHNGAVVIGNGRNSSKRDWPHTHIQSYALFPEIQAGETTTDIRPSTGQPGRSADRSQEIDLQIGFQFNHFRSHNGKPFRGMGARPHLTKIQHPDTG